MFTLLSKGIASTIGKEHPPETVREGQKVEAWSQAFAITTMSYALGVVFASGSAVVDYFFTIPPDVLKYMGFALGGLMGATLGTALVGGIGYVRYTREYIRRREVTGSVVHADADPYFVDTQQAALSSGNESPLNLGPDDGGDSDEREEAVQRH